MNSRITLLGAGWKSISLIDVHNSVTFTLWLCGCNLKCPFCHNWLIALGDRSRCRILDIETLLDKVSASKPFIDYFHVTGGEPLVQWSELMKLLKAVKDIGVNVSIDSNLTLLKPLTKLIESNLVDHVATDAKIPPEEMYGLPCNVSKILWTLFLEGLRTVTSTGIPLELRIPVARNVSIETYRRYLHEVVDRIDGRNYYVIVQPLLGPPIVSPRDVQWCNKYCNPDPEILERVADVLREYGVSRVYVKHFGRVV